MCGGVRDVWGCAWCVVMCGGVRDVWVCDEGCVMRCV